MKKSVLCHSCGMVDFRKSQQVYSFSCLLFALVPYINEDRIYQQFNLNHLIYEFLINLPANCLMIYMLKPILNRIWCLVLMLIYGCKACVQ